MAAPEAGEFRLRVRDSERGLAKSIQPIIVDLTARIDQILKANQMEAEKWRGRNPALKMEWFGRRVWPGKAWDYKLKSPFRGNRFYYKENVRSGEWFGNYHYGYVGAAAGFSLDRLLKGGDIAHNITDKEPGWQLDQPWDKAAIEEGFRDYPKF